MTTHKRTVEFADGRKPLTILDTPIGDRVLRVDVHGDGVNEHVHMEKIPMSANDQDWVDLCAQDIDTQLKPAGLAAPAVVTIIDSSPERLHLSALVTRK